MNAMSPYIPTLANWLMAPEASDVAGDVHGLYYFLVYVSGFFFLAIIALMVVFTLKYRRRSPKDKAQKTPTHHYGLEAAWSIPPLVIVIVVFVLGLKGFIGMSGRRANALEVKVNAWQWNWEFVYTTPEGVEVRVPELHLEVDRPVVLTLNSQDVIHSLWIPAFGVKRDAVPGRYNKIAFTPTVTSAEHGSPFPLLCTEYCGTQHSTMLSTVTVHERGMFEVWLKEASKAPLDELQKQAPELYAQYLKITTNEQFQQFMDALKADNPELHEKVDKLQRPALVGAELYTAKGCAQCHSTDGTRLTGPSLKGLWGAKRVFTDGAEAEADENYIRSAIVNPMETIVSTYQGVMPSYQGKLSDPQIDAFIAYIRSLDEAAEQDNNQP